MTAPAAAAATEAVNPDVVIGLTCRLFHCNRQALLSTRHNPMLVEARAFATWILRSVGPRRSYVAIGSILHRHHTTVIDLHRKAICLRLTKIDFLAACNHVQAAFATLREEAHEHA